MTEKESIVCPTLLRLKSKIKYQDYEIRKLKKDIDNKLSLKNKDIIRHELEGIVRTIIDEILDEKRRMDR